MPEIRDLDMSVKTSYQKYTLDFKFDAGTSRGVLKTKDTFFIKIWDSSSPEKFGLGECGPLKGLSVDDRSDLDEHIEKVLNAVSEQKSLPQNKEEAYLLANELVGADFPSIRFGLETALLDLLNGGERKLFNNDFVLKQQPLPINGLIWMGEMDFMKSQVDRKIEEGYTCIKMKIGAIDFEKEFELLSYIRSKDTECVLRVDANGGFSTQEAQQKLERLAELNLHSIEQPIKQHQWTEMSRLCETSPVPIALDEELIGVYAKADKIKLLEELKPQYIILKPTLLGGFQSCLEWLSLAEARGIGWWLTSALESNIGLNAICQFAAELQAPGHQGLGTGKLYHNNIASPLEVVGDFIRYNSTHDWDLSQLKL
ncbi:o-succinylbenzoate synthase [Fulvivirga maritima]|uniref:o-succinylbenzoate synthase n=1 Tax=Fulvivirga maritima TaxID=2904247 RepID=UPI001F22C714|nr:o-succinylbenzoate synthase [Fulvivirga maritima]UII24930.1 o-succinylbenzoate synthase [Fulvivirga maritima]